MAFARVCEEVEACTLGLARNVSQRMVATLFADGARRWQSMESPSDQDEALASLSPPSNWLSGSLAPAAALARALAEAFMLSGALTSEPFSVKIYEGLRNHNTK